MRRYSAEVMSERSAGLYFHVLVACTIVIATCAPVQADNARVTGVARVIDGDTLDVGAVRIRLHGIDAPEEGQRCGREVKGTWPCGTRATNTLAELVNEKKVECTVRDRDHYGRVIAVCRKGAIDLNALLVREGLAWAYRRFSKDYAEIEAEARKARRGIWQGKAEAPWEYRANRWERAAAASPRPGCPIKGNINRQGEKIYHTPWSRWYSRTKVDESKGQRWFCNEEEARKAGWRPPRSR